MKKLLVLMILAVLVMGCSAHLDTGGVGVELDNPLISEE